MKLLTTILGAIALLASTFSFASSSENYFFKNRYGEEISYSVSMGSDGELDYTFVVPDHIDPMDALYDYVTSTLNSENYIYVQDGAPCDDCQVGHQVPMKPQRVVGRFAWANKFIESIASAFGTRVANDVYDRAKNQSKDNTPFKYVMIHNGDRRSPVAMCKLYNGGCPPIQQVSVELRNNNKFAIFLERRDEYRYIEQQAELMDAISDYAGTINYRCVVASTGTEGNMKTEIVCFPSY